MKIAILSDIHANWIALQAVAAEVESWQPDLVIVAGDLVNRGPRPLECLRFVLEKQRAAGWQIVLGNHEEYVLSQATPEAPRSGPSFAVHQASCWTYTRLQDQMAALQAMPFDLRWRGPDSGLIHATHASLRGTRDGVYHQTTDEELAKKIVPEAAALPPALFLVGHTHVPLIRRIHETLVVNAGSAGLPFDRDTRPSYARVEWRRQGWQAEIRRVAYDLAAAEKDFALSGYLDEAGPLIRLVVKELRLARGQLGGWVDRFQKQVLGGKISMQESVQQFIRESDRIAL